MPGNIAVVSENYVMSLPGVPPRTFTAGEQIQPYSRHYYPMLWAGAAVEGGSPGITLPPEISGASGAGSPEGVLTAPVGQLYIDTANTRGAGLWQKFSGSGNTGWRVVFGDTGWRNVNSLIPGGIRTGGNLLVRRVAMQLMISFDDLQFGGATGSNVTTSNFPDGFVMPNGVWPPLAFALVGGNIGGNAFARFEDFTTSFKGMTFPNAPSTLRLRSYVEVPPDLSVVPWPTTLPGSAA